MRAALREEGSALNTTTANKNVPKIERQIKFVKEGVRSTWNFLPYQKFANRMISCMVDNAVFWLNVLLVNIGMSRTISLQMLMTGTTIDSSKHCKIEFGEGTRQIPLGTQTADPPSTGRTHAGGRHLRGPAEGRAEATREGEEEERMDFVGHVETRRREVLRAKEDKGPVKDSEADPSNRGNPQRVQEEESRDSGRRCGSPTWGGTANATVCMATT